jgi:hypothetical protein
MGNSDTQDSPRPRLGGRHHLLAYSILCSSPRGPHPNGFFSRDSHLGVSKFPHLGFPRLWGRITSCANLWLQWNLKQSCSPRQELFDKMLQVAYTQGNRVDSWLLVVRSQIVNLIPDPSFVHNLCFRCPNKQCEPILYIYVSIAFQWYKKLFDSMSLTLAIVL